MLRKGEIRLSLKHGVNPAIPKCFFCGQDKSQIILPGLLPGDREAPKGAVWDMEPCDNCKSLMEQGVMFVSVRDGESGDNPYRTGRMAVVSEDWVRRRIRPQDMVDHLLQCRFGFIEDTVWKALGLPEEDIDNRPNRTQPNETTSQG